MDSQLHNLTINLACRVRCAFSRRSGICAFPAEDHAGGHVWTIPFLVAFLFAAVLTVSAALFSRPDKLRK